jgi:hypothetical protein
MNVSLTTNIIIKNNNNNNVNNIIISAGTTTYWYSSPQRGVPYLELFDILGDLDLLRHVDGGGLRRGDLVLIA